jgi:hypothetical protein
VPPSKERVSQNEREIKVVVCNPKVFLPQLCCTFRDSPEVLKHILGEKRLAMSERMVGADGGLMVSQRGLTQRAVRSAQAKPIAWLRCMKTRESMTVSLGRLNWCNETHHEQLCIGCLLPAHSWMNGYFHHQHHPHIHTPAAEGKEKATVREPSPLPFLQRIG